MNNIHFQIIYSIKFITQEYVILVVSLGPHGAYFHRRKFEPQVEKVSTARNIASVKSKNY